MLQPPSPGLCAPSEARSAGSSQRRISAARRGCGTSWGGTTRPDVPFWLTQGTPVGSAVLMTERPGQHSFDLDHTNASCRLTEGSASRSAAAIPLEPLGVGDVAEEADGAGDAQLASQRFQRSAQRPVANDDERGGDAGHGPQQHVHALVGDQPADEEYRRPAARARGSGRRPPAAEGTRIESVRDDDDLVQYGASAGTSRIGGAATMMWGGAAQPPVQQRLIERPVPPSRADRLAVEPDDQRRRRTRQGGSDERHRVGLVQYHDVGLGVA